MQPELHVEIVQLERVVMVLQLNQIVGLERSQLVQQVFVELVQILVH